MTNKESTLIPRDQDLNSPRLLQRKYGLCWENWQSDKLTRDHRPTSPHHATHSCSWFERRSLLLIIAGDSVVNKIDLKKWLHLKFLLNTMFILSGKGRYLTGIDSQVFLPIMTAFCLPKQYICKVSTGLPGEERRLTLPAPGSDPQPGIEAELVESWCTTNWESTDTTLF